MKSKILCLADGHLLEGRIPVAALDIPEEVIRKILSNKNCVILPVIRDGELEGFSFLKYEEIRFCKEADNLSSEKHE